MRYASTAVKPKFTKKMEKSFLTPYKLQELEFLLKEMEYGLDIQTNTIYLSTEVNVDSLYETIARFRLLMKCNGTRSPITLNVSSFGGDVYSMFGIHDFIRTCAVKIDTICVGPAMSAAAFLLACGTGVRYMTENSTVMFHQFSTTMEGKTSQVINNATHVNKLQSRADELLGQYTKKPKSFWQKETKEDLFLTAHECLTMGIVDKVVPTEHAHVGKP